MTTKPLISHDISEKIKTYVKNNNLGKQDEIIEEIKNDINALSSYDKGVFQYQTMKMIEKLQSQQKRDIDNVEVTKSIELYKMLGKQLVAHMEDSLLIEKMKRSGSSLLINRDNLARALSLLRYQNGINGKNTGYPEGSIEIREGVFINISSQKYFSQFKKEYEEAIKNNNIVRMYQLDTELAELLIIESKPQRAKKNYYIQINNDELLSIGDKNAKTRVAIIENAKLCEKSLKALGYDVEYVVLIGPQEKEYHVVRMKEESPVIVPPVVVPPEPPVVVPPEPPVVVPPEPPVVVPPEPPVVVPPEPPVVVLPEPEEYNLSASLSDVTSSQWERIALEVEEQLKDEYRKMGNRNVFKKAGLFLQRGRRRKNLMKQKLAELENKPFTMNDTLDDELTSAADRHELERLHNIGASNIESKKIITIPEVNALSREYLSGGVDDHQFKERFNTIIENNRELETTFAKANIDFISTNILEKLKLEKAQFTLIETVAHQLDGGRDDAKANAIQTAIQHFMQTYQKAPEFLTMFEDALKDPEKREKLAKYIKHQSVFMKMKIKNLNMKLEVLTGGKSAYQIDNKDREKNWLYKLGHKLDKIPRYLQIPGYTGVGVLLGVTGGAVGLGVVGTSILTTAAFSGTTGFVNFIKKWTHYTKEQNTHEKNIVTDYAEEQKKIANLKDIVADKAANNWFKRYRAKRQLELYDNATQQGMRITNELTDILLIGATKIGVPVHDDVQLQALMLEAKARLEVYKETGHNFLASNEKEKIEQDMRRLQKALVLSSQRARISLADLATITLTDVAGNNMTLQSIKDELQGDYDRSLTSFRSERRNLATKYGLGTALASAATAIGFQAIFNTGMFSDPASSHFSNITKVYTGSDHYALGGRDITGGVIQSNANTMFADPSMSGASTVIHYGAGTDGTLVRAGSLLNSHGDYLTRVHDVITNINAMSLSPAQKAAFIHEVSSRPRESMWSSSGFTNDYLFGSRCLDILENTAQGLASSGNTSLTISGFTMDPTLSPAGTAVHDAATRIGNVVLEMTKEQVTNIPGHASKRWVPIPLFFNTFKRKEDNKEDDKKVEVEEKKINVADIPDFKPTVVDPRKNPSEVFNDPDWKDEKKIETFKKGYDVKTRGQRIHSDAADYGEDYPGDGKLASIEIVSRKIVYDRIGLTQQDKQEIASIIKNGGSNKDVNEYIQGVITNQRKEVELLKETRNYEKILQECYNKIPQHLGEILGAEKLNKMNKLMKKDRIHVVGDYDYMNIVGVSRSLGVFRATTGDIYIASSYLKQFSSDNVAVEEHNENVSHSRLQWELRHILTHEMLHSMSVISYAEKGNIFEARRVGLRQVNLRRGESRGVGINEGVTEMLAQEILKRWYESEGVVSYKAQWIAYPDQQDIIKQAINADNEFDWLDLSTAMLLRKESDGLEVEKETPLYKLVRKVNGGEGVENVNNWKRPYYYEMLMSMLDYVLENGGSGKDAIVDFVKTKNIRILQNHFGSTLSAVFPKWLLNKNQTNFREEILNAYTPSGVSSQ